MGVGFVPTEALQDLSILLKKCLAFFPFLPPYEGDVIEKVLGYNPCVPHTGNETVQS